MRFKKTRYIPENAITVEHPAGLGLAYVYRCRGKYAVIAYGGKRTSADFHFIYADLEKAHDRIERWFDGLNAHVAAVKDRRAKSFAGHTFKVGDIVTNSWGYDQTNVDWYRVTRTSASYVWLREISAQVEETGFMSGRSVPHVDTTDADPTKWNFRDIADRKEFRRKASGDHVTMRHGCGSKWDGREKYASWYA